MKNAETTVTCQNGVMTIARGNKENTAYLSRCAELPWNVHAKLAPIDSCVAYVRLPATEAAQFANPYCTLVNGESGRFMDVIIDHTPSTDPAQLEITRVVATALQAQPGEKLLVCRQRSGEFDAVKVQTLNNIKDDVLALPCDAFLQQLAEEFTLFEVINPLTSDSIYVRSKHIVFDPSLKPSEIRLNKKQRNMLSDNIPTRLTKEQWDELMQGEHANGTFAQTMAENYGKDYNGYTLLKAVDTLDYSVRRSLQKYIKDNFGENLIVRPVLESFYYEKKKKLHRRLCDLFVGKSTLSLNCRRPHECDENANVVRMSETNMLFLGIEPMDKVVIRYKENEVSCHVLPFCLDKFSLTNVPSIIELSIGIPAHIRNELNITDIQSSVKVDRDTAFIFKKSFNEQLVPIILTLLSLKFVEQLPWYVSVALVAILIPIVMYITLSPKRNMRGK